MTSMNSSCVVVNYSRISCSCNCTTNMTEWDKAMNQLYTYFYLIIFIPGLLGNTLALWVLCRFISKKTKAIIFMINLAMADLAHVLSLPLRIHYYIREEWPFGNELCLLCFYLKYLNMYASIAFLVCISIQRCAFLMRPFCAKGWKRRYDVRISVAVWIVVGLCCSPFILMRSKSAKETRSCFKDLPMRKLDVRLAISMMAAAELLGFVSPLIIISFCTYLIVSSLQKQYLGQQSTGDKQKALRMVRVCTGVFLFCFAPYHINFLLYLMVSQCIITDCALSQAVRQFHPVSLCMASLNCCLNPLIYYFLTTEFRQQLSRQGSSVLRGRLMSLESTSSYRE
ncbi:putative P2Y purinoceptor 10 [Myxocyprinus asiaticus]|uniref:putative P2Y purinoceptor 10 n=1 Tax=Myxocyprinus asiaticus TaxID=70543 RepID=UPI002221BABA|nr:putative P2Y purinoceptor 10 [Myxocyprinus asiaticus]XP_051514556.1 putative P2Y purinoceptor 10 [Myxocyprinus asiaticus]XP_051514557.1 putative P2Y purinoceptor 10 [Myxocyprinus asiaticus]XP_051514558.1 putative P2Y purinoceptor 10 [Myxocyprinus asiaticus]XP_051514559.1 putative P2Y purinoceptor 10 [Myxocyprinus asiaticus]